MKIEAALFRVESDAQVDLTDRPTAVEPLYKSKKKYKKHLKKRVKKLASLQRLHYASGHWAFLVIFQGMDAAGKDGAIRHVMSGVNPQGCQVFSFKQPTDQELDHDFLWRTNRCLPEPPGIFRTVVLRLIPRVMPPGSDRTIRLPLRSVCDIRVRSGA